jgi:hypothetical protein
MCLCNLFVSFLQVPRLRISSSNWKKNLKSLPDAQPHLWYYALSIAENSFLAIMSTREDPWVDLCHLGLEITIYAPNSTLWWSYPGAQKRTSVLTAEQCDTWRQLSACSMNQHKPPCECAWNQQGAAKSTGIAQDSQKHTGQARCSHNHQGAPRTWERHQDL